MIVIGTRPEAIKMAPVARELLQHPADITPLICASEQHRDLLGQAMPLMGLRPDSRLGVMEENQTLAGLTARLFDRLDPVLAEQQPDWVLVQGDTTTAMAAAMAAFYRRVRVGHVEAGL